jgi:exonuclease SbcD
MRIVHTSDWHLGHTLHEVSRDYEHRRFLDWLLHTLDDVDADALIIAGDLFDAANPTAAAQALWFEFVAAARRRRPRLDLLVIGGNHDSAARLDAPGPLYRALGVRVVGGPTASPDDMTLPLGDAVVAAVPFLRPSDLVVDEAAPDPLVEGVRRRYAEVLDAARARRRPGQALLATGHCYMVGTRLSELSERKILGGNLHALPVDIFADDVAYVALGHLHLAQTVGGRTHVRYSGSPIPLALAEAAYRHQVTLVELDGERLADVRALEVPRAVPILRVGPAALDEVVAQLDALALPEVPDEERPLVEVRVRLAAPEPALRRRVEAALEGRPARLCKLTVEHAGDGRALAEATAAARLAELAPEEVFRRRYRRDHPGEPSPELLAAFRSLVEAVEAE